MIDQTYTYWPTKYP